MDHSFTCPDCGCDHCEPYDATFVLHVRCFDCTILLELHDANGVVTDLASAA